MFFERMELKEIWASFLEKYSPERLYSISREIFQIVSRWGDLKISLKKIVLTWTTKLSFCLENNEIFWYWKSSKSNKWENLGSLEFNDTIRGEGKKNVRILNKEKEWSGMLRAFIGNGMGNKLWIFLGDNSYGLLIRW